jgi:PQQ-like domain
VGEDLVLSETVAAALRLAATERPAGRPLTTGCALSALARTDLSNGWQRIWLHTGDPLLLGLAGEPDLSDAEPAGGLGTAGLDQTGPQATPVSDRWEGVPLSKAMANSLKLLKRVSSVYGLVPAPSGVMALALVADPASGAARALLRSGGLSHAELLELVQSDLLGTTLNGVRDLISGSGARRSPAARAPADRRLAARPPAIPPLAARPLTRRSQVAGPQVTAPSSAVTTPVPSPLEGAWTAAATRRRVRWPLRRWRALSCLALALTVLAIFWNRQVEPSTAPLVLPPYPVPAVAHQMLTTADLPSAGVGGWLQMQEGPPDDPLFMATGRLRADVRNTEFASAWERTWMTADSSVILQVAAYVARTRSLATGFMPGLCVPPHVTSLPRAPVAGFVQQDQGNAQACAIVLRGRTVLVFVVVTEGSAASTTAWHVLSASVQLQVPRVAATATDSPVRNFIAADTTTEFNTLLMVVVVAIPLLLGLITVIRDRSSWRRLRSRFSIPGHLLAPIGGVPAPGVFSVDPLVRVRIAQLTALALARIAVIEWSVRLAEHWHLNLYATGGAVAVTIAGILTSEWLIRGRTAPAAWRPAVFAGRRKVIGAVSVLLSAGIAAAGVFLVVDGLAILAVGGGSPSAQVSDLAVTQAGRGLPIFGAVLIVAALLPFTLARRLGMRALRNQAAKERPADEERHPVLMLRSFADDRRLLRARRSDRASVVERLCLRRFERFEEVVAGTLAVHGPVLALSQPKEKLPPPLGAERRSFSMADWQDHIRELIADARLICVTVGRSQSLLWEISEIRAAGALDRAIFVLPPTGKAEQRRRLLVLAYALGIDSTLLDATRPDRDVLAVVFPGGHAAAPAVPVVITAPAPDDVGYEAAVGAWALVAASDQRTFTADLRRLATDLASYMASGAAEDEAARFATRQARFAQTPPNVRRLIYAPGKAPVYKPWSRRLVSKQVLPWLLSVLIVPTAVKLIGASGVPSNTIFSHYPVTELAGDQDSPAVYAVLDGHLIGQIAFDSSKASRITRVSDGMSVVAVQDQNAYYADTSNGHVGRIDLATGRTRWIRTVPVGVKSLALSDGRVVVTSPGTGQVTELSASDGHVLLRRTLSGTPFGVAAAGKTLYVTLARSNAVAELDADTLATRSIVPVPAGPRAIYAAGSQVWVVCRLAHELVPIGTPALRPVWLSTQDAEAASNNGLLAVEGMEWVSVLSPNGKLTRVSILQINPESLVAQQDGSIIVGYETGEIDKYGPAKS